MAINVDYGSIQDALGLANQAGAADRNRVIFEQNQAQIASQQAAQRIADQQRATEIQASLGQQNIDLEGQRNQATSQLAQAQMANTHAYQQGMLGVRSQAVQNQDNYQQGRVGALKENADTNQGKAANTGQFQKGMLGVAQTNSDTKATAVANQGQTGQQNANTKTQEANDQALLGEWKQLQAARSPLDDPNDPNVQARQARINQLEGYFKQRNTGQQQALPQAPKVQPHGQPQGQQQQQNQQPGTTPANPVQVTTQAQYAALPPGAYYVDPQGTPGQKGAPGSPSMAMPQTHQLTGTRPAAPAPSQLPPGLSQPAPQGPPQPLPQQQGRLGPNQQGPQYAPPAPGTAANPVNISHASQIGSLPPGTFYIGLTGKVQQVPPAPSAGPAANLLDYSELNPQLNYRQ